MIVRFEVFTAVTMKNGVFWVVTPCGSWKNRRFGGTWRLLHPPTYAAKKYQVVFLRSVRRLLVAACVVPSSPIFSPWWRRRQVSPKRRFLQEPHGVTTQKTPFFNVNYVSFPSPLNSIAEREHVPQCTYVWNFPFRWRMRVYRTGNQDGNHALLHPHYSPLWFIYLLDGDWYYIKLFPLPTTCFTVMLFLWLVPLRRQFFYRSSVPIGLPRGSAHLYSQYVTYLFSV
jgi:hypothetical protein